MFKKNEVDTVHVPKGSDTIGIFAVFDIKIDEDISSIKHFIIQDIIENNTIKVNRDLSNFINIVDENSFNITFCAFNVSVRKLSEEDVLENITIYTMPLNYSMYFELYQSSNDKEKDFMIFLGCIMRRFKGDCVLAPNGSEVIVRKNNIIIVDEEGTSRFDLSSYNLLGLKYSCGKIEY